MNATSRRVALPALCSSLFVLALVFGPTARSQAPQAETHEQRAARFRQMSIDAETKGLAEPFKGITTNGPIEPGLFADPLDRRVDRARPRRRRTRSWPALTPAQRDKTTFAVDDAEWRKWMNQDFYVRQGVSFLEMTDAQREVGVRAAARVAQRQGPEADARHHAAEPHARRAERQRLRRYGEWRYHITVMGTPSATEPWGWQLDGHHAIINYFVLGDQVVMTPFFAGSEPVIATAGKFKGTSVLQDEQNQGLALINALDEAQRAESDPRGCRRPATTT